MVDYIGLGEVAGPLGELTTGTGGQGRAGGQGGEEGEDEGTPHGEAGWEVGLEDPSPSQR